MDVDTPELLIYTKYRTASSGPIQSLYFSPIIYGKLLEIFSLTNIFFPVKNS